MNLEGRRFGRLDTKNLRGKARDGTDLYFCRCFCGNTTLASAYELLHGYKTSCGCKQELKFLKKEADKLLHKKTTKPNSGLHTLYNNYRKGAEQRKLEFKLSLIDFEKLTSSVCNYCGKKPELLKDGKMPYIYNGIDRVDNTKGYFLENCVTCCKNCNRAKNTMTVQDFLAMVANIHKNKLEVYLVESV